MMLNYYIKVLYFFVDLLREVIHGERGYIVYRTGILMQENPKAAIPLAGSRCRYFDLGSTNCLSSEIKTSSWA